MATKAKKTEVGHNIRVPVALNLKIKEANIQDKARHEDDTVGINMKHTIVNLIREGIEYREVKKGRMAAPKKSAVKSKK